MAKLKVCGVRDLDSLNWLDYAADYIGFVYSPGTPRNIDPLEADSYASTLSRARPVLVVTERSPSRIIDIAGSLKHIEIIQIHSVLPPVEIAVLARALGDEGVSLSPVLLWNGVWERIDPCRLYRLIKDYNVNVEYVLMDRRKGIKERIPRRLIEEAVKCVPHLGVAGGLDPDYICRVLGGLNPMLVDVSSWVESSPGVKDLDKVLSFKKSVEVCLS
ncbi:MAG: hypothetical protein GSR85_04065 [Desulfurococcales archaeon]|nr:hypothetical protein [Desulfurococcales archaeon]